MPTSSSLNKEKIITALKSVALPNDSSADVISTDLISGITIHGDRIGFLVAGDATAEPLRQACEAAVSEIDGVNAVTAVLTSHQSGQNPSPAPDRAKAVWNREPITGITKVIAVASGKGGVGKSSMTVLLAEALAKLGQKVGLLDADIYGPSIPTMFGLNEQAEIKDGKLIPQVAHGISAMSMGLIVGDQATVMRAPRVTKALNQMLRGTDWAPASEPLDVLLVDLPPGTGDVHLSMVQNTPIDGAIIITLASKVAALDAKKSIEMFEKVEVPVLGIIENMSSMQGGLAPFGSGGGEELSHDTGYNLLAKLPLEPAIGEMLNQGNNPFSVENNSELLKQIEALAQQHLLS